MSIQDGGPAFPVADYDHMVFEPKTVAETKRDLSGMSLRDYFAAKALQGMSANPYYDDYQFDTGRRNGLRTGRGHARRPFRLTPNTGGRHA